MLRLLPAVALLAVVSCTCNKPACNVTNCDGCCAAGVCQPGNLTPACGNAGNRCMACATGMECSVGFCVMSPGTGGGSGGGAATGGGATGGGAPGGGAAGGGGGGTSDAGGGNADAGIGCFDDTDCPNPQLFFCNTITSTCEPACRTKSDCTQQTRGMFALPECDNDPLGCNCDEGACKPALCSSDIDCPTLICRNGQCGTSPGGAEARCEVVPDFAILRGGQMTEFQVLAWDSNGVPVTPVTPPHWTALNTTVTSFNGGLVQAASTSSVIPESDLVRVNFIGAQCIARGIILPDSVDAGTIGVVAWDEATGRPVSGAKVVFSDPTTGGVIGTPVSTDTNGFAKVAATPPVSVSVMSADFDYQTIVAYSPSSTTAARMLAFPLRRNPLDRMGGVTGTMTGVPMTSNVHIGWASIAQRNFHELPPQAPDVMTHVKIGSAVDTNTPVPTRNTLGFSDQPIKTTWSALGPSGVCFLDGGVPNGVAIASGACGTGALWGYGLDVPLGDVPIDALVGGPMNINWGALLSSSMPAFKNASSVVQRDSSWTLATTPAASDGGLDLTSTSGFTAQDLPFGQVPLAFVMTAQVPALPQLNGQFLDVVWMRGFAVAPGRGLVDLGVGSAVNTSPRDQFTDKQTTYPAAGLAPLRMAPAHHGLEGSFYALSATAYSASELPFPKSGSGVVTYAQSLAFDPTGLTPIMLPAFLPFAEHGSFKARTFLFTAAPTVGAATEARVVFTGPTGARWVARFNPATAAQAFALPVPPSPLFDRTTWDGTTRAAMAVQLLELSSNGPITFARLSELDDIAAGHIADYTMAWSVLDLGHPAIAWKSPAASGATVTHGSTVTVHVDGFNVGPDGFVRLTFGGGSGCTQVDATMDPGGLGDISLTIPVGCMGNVTLTATLFDLMSQALPGPVSASITATVN
jgi:hypothetical protein